MKPARCIIGLHEWSFLWTEHSYELQRCKRTGCGIVRFRPKEGPFAGMHWAHMEGRDYEALREKHRRLWEMLNK